MTWAVLSLLPPVAAAWSWLEVLRFREGSGSRAVTAASAFALGVGWSSAVFMWAVMLGVPAGSGLVAADLVIWLAVAALGVRRLRRQDGVPRAEAVDPNAGAHAGEARARLDEPVVREPGRHAGAGEPEAEPDRPDTRAREVEAPSQKREAPGTPPRAPLTGADRAARAVFLAIVALAVSTALAEYAASPHGQWDAWAMWNQKARFLVRGGDQWTEALVNQWSQPGHPLLVSASVARLWAYAGAEPTAAPALLAAFAGVAIVAGVMGALDVRRPHAWVAGAVLLAPGTFIREVMSQQADIPLALFMVLAIVALRMDRGAPWAGAATKDVGDGPESGSTIRPAVAVRSALLVGGALAGFSAWAKNEGLLFLGIATVLAFWAASRLGHRRLVVWWMAGAVPGVLTVAAFKLIFAPSTPQYFPEGQTMGTVVRSLFDPQTHAAIRTAIGAGWLDWGGPLAAGALPLVVVGAVVVCLREWGWRPRAPLAMASRTTPSQTMWSQTTLSQTTVPLTAAFLMVAVFYAVWVVSPLETAWLVGTTFSRLVAQVWPLLVLALFSGLPSDVPDRSAEQ